MHLRRGLYLLTLLLLVPASSAAGEAPPVRTDRHGDPLPAGAVARLGTTRLRPGDDTCRLAFAPDGKSLAAGSFEGQLTLWEVASGKELWRVQADPNPINQLAMCADGKLLAFAQYGGSKIHLYDPVTGKLTHKLETGKGSVSTLALSPDGRLLAWAEDVFEDGELEKGHTSTGHLWDVTARKEIAWLDGLAKNVVFLAFTPEGETLVVGTADADSSAIRFWDLATRKVRHQFQAKSWHLIGDVLSADGKFLASSNGYGLFILRDATSGKEIGRFGSRSRGQTCPCVQIYLSPDGKTLAACGPDHLSGDWEGMVRLWDIATGKEVGRIQAPWHGDTTPGCAAFSPDSRLLAVCGADHAIHLFDLATVKERPQDGGQVGDVGRVAFSPDGKLLATASWDGVHLWDAAGNELSNRPTPILKRNEWVDALAFTEDGKRLVASGDSGTVQVWDVTAARPLRYRNVPKGDWRAVGLSPNASILVLRGTDPKCLLAQELATGKTVWRLDCGDQRITCLALSPQGQTAAMIDQDGTIDLWNLKEEKRSLQIPRNKAGSSSRYSSHLAFSLDGKTLASIRSEDGVRLWEVATGQERLRLKDLPPEVRSIAFTPNGSLLAGGVADGTIGLWDTATGERLYLGPGHRGIVWHLAFSADSKRLLSGSADTTALLWDVPRLLSPRQPDK